MKEDNLESNDIRKDREELLSSIDEAESFEDFDEYDRKRREKINENVNNQKCTSKPMSKEDTNKRLSEADKNIETGNYYSTDQILWKIEEWD